VKFVVILIATALVAALIATSSVLHGQVDFATPPTFHCEFGHYNAIIFFKTSTVLRVNGGTWFIAPVPFYILAPGMLAIPFCFWFFRRGRNHEDAAQTSGGTNGGGPYEP
jgi:hypothetical protein